MIKFFRKIRQKLLSDNKFSKYFLYAIGEIVLVVIGILIALQINNWNDHRKERQEEQRILKQFRSDLRKDSLHLSNLLKSSDKRVGAIDTLFTLLANPESANKRKFINLAIFNVGFEGYFKVNSATYDQSVSAGTAKYIINDSLRQSIFDYYRDAKLNYEDNLNTKQVSEQILPELFKKVMATKEVMSIFGAATRMPGVDINALGQDPDFMAILTQKIATESVQQRVWKGFINQTKSLIMSIDKELKL